MIKTLLLIVAAAVVVVLVYAATKPDTFSVERRTVVNAPPERVYALVADLHEFNKWNPWARKDPAMTSSYSGPASGPGSSYAWISKEVGVGSMTIAELAAPSRVSMRLDFEKPFEAHNSADFTLTPQAGGTLVTWTMHGPAPYISKLMTTFFSMDKMVGNDFEAGLAGLKALAEGK